MSDTEILEIFLQEAREILENLESDLVLLEEEDADSEIINRVFRYFHTLKGSSGIAGFNEVYEFSHHLETLLDNIRNGVFDINKEKTDLILHGIDWIKDVIFSDPSAKKDEIKKDLLHQLNKFVPTEVVSNEVSDESGSVTDSSTPELKEKYYKIKAEFREDIYEFGTDPLMIIEDLSEAGEFITQRVYKSKLSSFEELDPEKCYFSWEIIIKLSEGVGKDKLDDIFLFVSEKNDITIEDVTVDFYKEDSSEYLPQEKKIGEIMVDSGLISEDDLDETIAEQEHAKSKIGDILVKKGLATEDDVELALNEQKRIKKAIDISTVRVDTLKLDKLLNLLGEIVIGQSSLVKIADDLDEESKFVLKNALHGLERTTREFQEQIMSIRMVPIGPTFDQFRRFVRDSSHALGKDIHLIVNGADTELDKTVIEKIGDPLKHMIRNSIDHGIESSEDRVKAGKDSKGVITLNAYHQEGNVYIEIVDDGCGIDLEKVREKALKLKLIKSDEDVSNDKLYSFLFHPGFSTAEKIGDLSGRGVGMDVVKTNIEKLRGMVEISSEQGQGTIMRIKLPLTLAIIDGMLVKIGDYIYIIPMLSVIETVRPKKEDIKTVEGKGELIQYRGDYLSLVRLYDLFGIETEVMNPWESLVVFVESAKTRIGLLIDDMIGQQQIVIKSLDNFITNSKSISGAAILGDGRVALIIDLFGLIEDISRE